MISLQEEFQIAQRLFHQSGAPQWLEANCVFDEREVVDMDATLEKLGITVEYRPMFTHGYLSKDGTKIIANEEDDLLEQRVTVGHEIGHLIIECLIEDDEEFSELNAVAFGAEAFCEIVGYQLMMPKSTWSEL